MNPDIRRFLLVAGPALTLVAIIGFIWVAAPRLLAAVPHAAPNEPIAFDHSVHAGAAGIECTFCHRTVTTSGTAGFPEVQQCMFCHQVIGSSSIPPKEVTTSRGTEDIVKLRAAWQNQQPINWERVHRMPDHVRFLHEPHISAGLPCATCHGEVQNMGQVVQVRSLSMGDCLSCHRQNSAPTECATCHK